VAGDPGPGSLGGRRDGGVHQGVAWEGADRTLLYLAVFALFALWPQRPATGAWVLGAWTLALGVTATVTLLRVGAGTDLATLFADDRLISPAGYPNATAAAFLMALWPAVTLAAARPVPWPVRGLAVTAAVVLADVALLSQSRGSLLALPVCAVLFVALVPGRLRHLAVLGPIGLAAGLAAPTVLDLGPLLLAGKARQAADQAHTVRTVVLLAAVLAGAFVAAASWWEARRPLSAASAARVRRGWTAVVVGVAVAGVLGGAVAGDPVHRLHRAWTSFKGGYGDNGSGSRLTSGLGSNRYDFYRVALDEVTAHPIVGVGADNFAQDYLRQGRSTETPHYPHDVVLRTLAQTGIVGLALLLATLAAAFTGAWRATRTRDPLAVVVAGGATAGFLYWTLHGISDWFWEWAGLGAPAFALLGLAVALAPRSAAASAPSAPRAPAPGMRRRSGLAAGVLLLAAGVALAAPWLARREMDRAGAVFATRPFEAYARLDRAARLDRLSDGPALLKGSIALRYGDLPRARNAFEEAVARNPRGQYATLELGAIASAQSRKAAARRLLTRAVALAPRDPIARGALDVVGSGQAIDVAVLNRRILEVYQPIAGR
jgi:hypothetical protein